MFCVENDIVDHTLHNIERTAILFSLCAATKSKISQYVFILQVLNTLYIGFVTYFNKHELYLLCRRRVMSYEEEILKGDELSKEDCILEPEVIVTVKEEVKVSVEGPKFISPIICIWIPEMIDPCKN